VKSEHREAVAGELAAHTKHGIDRGIVNVGHEDVRHTYLTRTIYDFGEVISEFLGEDM
jgi:hypothetical protein